MDTRDKSDARMSIAEPFKEGLGHQIVRYQVCETCAYVQTLARYACQRCGNSRMVWRDASGNGTVRAVTVVARAPSEDFRPLAPYTLVLVQLDEGPRLMAHAEPGIQIGARVTATVFEYVGRPLLRFVRSEQR